MGWQNPIRTKISSCVRVMLGDRRVVDADVRASFRYWLKQMGEAMAIEVEDLATGTKTFQKFVDSPS